MNTYKFSLYNGIEWVDISDYITTCNIGDKLDEALDDAHITISNVKSDEIPNIDLSKGLPPYYPIKIEIGDETYGMYPSNTTRKISKKFGDILYTLDVNLIEATKILQRKPIPQMTITQPKSVIFDGKYYSNLRPNTIDVDTGMTIQNSYVYPDLDIINQSIDTSIVDGNILKADNDGKLLISLEIWNDQFNKTWFDQPIPVIGQKRYKYTNAEAELEVDVIVNGITIHTEKIYVSAGKPIKTSIWSFLDVDYKIDVPRKRNFNKIIELPKSTIDRTITLRMRTLGSYHKFKWVKDPLLYTMTQNDELEDTLRVTPRITLSSQTKPNDDEYYLDDVVDKVLDSVKLFDINDSSNQPKYILDDETRSKISNILSPEFTFSSNYYVWDVLKNIAGVVNAIPELSGDDFTTIKFNFLDDIPDVKYDISLFNDETISYTLDDYNSGLEVNAANVIEEDLKSNVKIEPYNNGWLTTRANNDLIGQIKESNSAFKVRQGIYRVYRMFIKGPGVKITNGTDTITLYGNNNEDYTKCIKYQDNLGNWIIPSDASFDLSDRVVEFERWNTYENGTANSNDGDRRTVNTKGNHIYYKQGSKYIDGLGYETETLDDWVGTKTPPKALMETILSSVADYISNTPELDGYEVVQPGGWMNFDLLGDPNTAFVENHDLFDGILAQVHYIPLASVRTTIYRSDVLNYGVDTVKYANEQDRMNDTNNLGRFIGNSSNKLGKPQITASGQAITFDEIPRLGYMTTDNKVIVSRNFNLNKNYIEYSLNLSEDFINQNPYLAPNSEFRQYEIPQDDYVDRKDTYSSFIVLSEDKTLVDDDFTPLSIYGVQKTIQNFGNLGGANYTPLSYGRMTITKEQGSTLTNNVVTFDLPVNGFSINDTVNLELEFDTNYSAGPIKYHDTLGSDENIYKTQTFSSYTSQFGRVHSLDLEVYPKGKINNSETDANNYPFATEGEVIGTSNLDLSLIINKDAREKYGLNIQFQYITAQDHIRVYDGIASYSGLIRDKEDIDIGIALLDNGYFPSKGQTIVDVDRIDELPNIGTILKDDVRDIYSIHFVDLDIPMGTYEGYVVYEKNTKELIYAVKRDLPNGLYTTPKMYFIPKTHRKLRTIPL